MKQKIKRNITRIKDFIRDDIWELELEELSKARARFIKYMKVIIITIKTFSAEKIGFQAVALSFFSTMSVVPLIAIIFGVTGGLGLADKLEGFLYGYFQNSQPIVNIVLKSANNIISTTQSGGMGLISGLLFAWIVVWMMLNVERVFNNVWRVRKSRNIFKRISYIIAMLLIAPFVVMVFFSGNILYSHLLESIGLDPETFGIFKTVLSWTLFGAIATFTFSAMYKFIPNSIVEYGNALKAALPAAIAFTAVNYLYLETQVLVTRLNAVYGVFAAVPLFMAWINIGWNIILIGSELSYAFQHVDNYNIDD
ncbi:MAG: YihY/virulence factor BrkB family protein [Bacteroidales bacterium]|jgi:membrane protein|nr:YihY/virulence factor BrkB family protein [Bacteroidales bacterium]MBQ5603591.1 YihY/virulence factor BrkB family protein [Bacteroidales bacterium]